MVHKHLNQALLRGEKRGETTVQTVQLNQAEDTQQGKVY